MRWNHGTDGLRKTGFLVLVGTCFGLGPTDVDFDTHLGSAPWLGKVVTGRGPPGSFKRSCLDFSWWDSN